MDRKDLSDFCLDFDKAGQKAYSMHYSLSFFREMTANLLNDVKPEIRDSYLNSMNKFLQDMETSNV